MLLQPITNGSTGLVQGVADLMAGEESPQENFFVLYRGCDRNFRDQNQVFSGVGGSLAFWFWGKGNSKGDALEE